MNNNDFIKKVKFSNLELSDSFFDSLRQDYEDFDEWFAKKSNNNDEAFVSFRNDGSIQALLYLKTEYEEDTTINPTLPELKKLKIGTFKIDAHQTALGQRFISIILRKLITEGYGTAYVTIYDKHEPLKQLFEKYGFKRWGVKNHELVYAKYAAFCQDPYKDFPRISKAQNNKYLLGIYPTYHTKLFPDSQLSNERQFERQDIAFSNAIEKCYLCAMPGVELVKPKDLIVIYRTNAGQTGAAFYKSVATSVCTVIATNNINNFSTFEEFRSYVGKGSIFHEDELKRLFDQKKYPYIIKMLYNFPLKKRITNGDLKTKAGLNLDYWGFAPLSDQQFDDILKFGGINENFVIN